MPDRGSTGLAFINLHEGEGRARNLLREAPQGANEGARENGLSGAQIAPERDYVAGTGASRKPRRKRGRHRFGG